MVNHWLIDSTLHHLIYLCNKDLANQARARTKTIYLSLHNQLPLQLTPTMKHNFVLLFLLLLQQAATAQHDNANKRDSSKVLNAKYFYTDLNNDKQEVAVTQLPFRKIRFDDVRYDTSFIAINWNLFSFTNTLNHKYDCNGGLASSLSRYFNRYYITSDSANGELVCYIKKFSITLNYELLDHFNAGSDLFKESKNDIAVTIECYYKTNGLLYPATRLDTVYTTHFINHEAKFTDAVKEMLTPLMYKTERLHLAAITNRKGYTAAQISDRYAERFSLPVLTSNVNKKGVYKSLAEFKNNTPSIDSFSISTDKLKYNATNTRRIDAVSLVTKAVQKRNTAVFLYDANHEMINPSSVFGYSDGDTFWIQHGAFYYPLIKIGNAFEFIYIYHYTDENHRTQTLYVLMPLNLETGHSN